MPMISSVMVSAWTAGTEPPMVNALADRKMGDAL
jgi:hypothetical protein